MSSIQWQEIFDDIFEGYPDRWSLVNVHRNDTSQNRALQSKRKVKREGYARFHCPKCSNGWASAKATVMFYYSTIGRVSMRFYGQQCRKCSRTKAYFVDPEFDEESIRFHLEKLFERIGWFCYNKPRPDSKKDETSKPNKIQGPHEKNLCEACKMGCCSESRS